MSATFYLKRGDTLPAMVVTLLDEDGAAIDTAGKTVTFRMHDPARGELKVNRTAPATAGVVTVTWLATEVDTEGRFIAEFHVDDGAGHVQTVPNYGQLAVVISPALAGSEPIDALVSLY